MRLLVLNFFPAFNPPSSGGELRFLRLYEALSCHAEVILISSTDFGARQEEIRHNSRLTEIRFPKDPFWAEAYHTLETSGVSGDLSGLAFALAVSNPECPLRKAAIQIAATVDVIVHEFPFSEPIFWDGAPAPEIYNSHNFELGLIASILQGPGVAKCFEKLRLIEQRLTQRSALVLATSEMDADRFRMFYGVPRSKLRVCPNGFSPADFRPRQSGCFVTSRPRLLFTGSGHRPNVDAATFLATLAADIPECDIVIAGGCANSVEAAGAPHNLVLIPRFDDEEKKELFRSADAFLNPILEGSGTNLKTVEALAAGLPLLSTPEGVRGINVENGRHALVASRAEFPAMVRRLITAPEQADALSAAGRVFAAEHLAWEHIAAALFANLQELLRTGSEPRKNERERLMLVLNDYAVVEGVFGGTRRIRELHAALDIPVVFVCLGQTFDIRLLSPKILHITVARSDAHEAFAATLNATYWQVSANDVVAGLFAPFNKVLVNILAELASRADVAIYEHCYMATTLDVIRAARPNLPIVYSSHNVEVAAKRELLEEHPIGPELVAFVKDAENALAKAARLVVTCSAADARSFAEIGAKTLVVANGCILPSRTLLGSSAGRAGPVNTLSVGFLGSSHPPNVEAARYIVAELAPLFPALQFEILGGVCSALDDPVPPNVVLHGTVAEERKTELMLGWSIALNPVTGGGGSSVKVADCLAHDVALICTPEGARGFELDARDAGIVVERPDIPEAITWLVDNPDGRLELAARGLAFARSDLAWAVATKPYRAALKRMMSAPAALHHRPNLLIVTYRYTEPPLGGAEEYLVEVTSRLRPMFDRIDLIAANVAHLTNAMHFGTALDVPAGTERVLGSNFDQVRLFAPEVMPKPQMFRLCRKLERQWAEEELPLLAPFLDRLAAFGAPVLLAGFYGPENHGGIWRRWTAGTFAVLLPAKSRTVQLRGFSQRRKRLSVTIGRWQDEFLPEHSMILVIDGGFEESLSWPGSDQDGLALLVCTVEEHEAEDDHRPLGLLLEAVEAQAEMAAPASGPALDTGADLVSGFYLPETHDGVVRRWTKEEFVFAVPPGADAVRIGGWSPFAKPVQFTTVIAGAPAGEPLALAVESGFDVTVRLPAPDAGQRFVRCRVDPHTVPNDDRVFGLLLETIELVPHGALAGHAAAGEGMQRKASSTADMTFDPTFFLRTRYLSEWVQGLAAGALRRSRDSDDSFAAVRGPHSPSMQAWLAANCARYDAILVQGIPFDTIPRSARTLREAGYGGRLVLLPHFHGDDRFYYWRDYLDAFRQASSTLLFSTTLAAELREFGTMDVVPGGGVKEEEVYQTGAFEAVKRNIGLDCPFFLVLGRKTSSKGYERAIVAATALRRAGTEVALLLIGPDEDGRPVEGENIFYIGRQPRDVVVSALSEALAVITLSQSESFGIVICEAWNFGKPVVANRACYSFRELVQHDVTGLLVESDKELHDALCRILDNRAEAVIIGQNGLKVVASAYHWGRVAAEIAAVIVSKSATHTAINGLFDV